MPNLNRRFSSGRMNKDLDERLVPNGEYRDALNIEVATSDTSDMGTVQTVMGNLNMSLITIDPDNTGEFYCVGSVVNEQHDKIYWMLAGRTSDIIAEYDYKTQTTTPVVVDLFPAGTIPGNESGRVLNFDRAFTITGINIIENMLFWTDNYSEPKRIHIDRCKLGTPDFTSQTQLYVRDISTNNASIDYYPKGDLKHEHITVIKKSPPAPPVLEMRNKLRVDQNPYGTNFASDFLIGIKGNFTTDPGNPFFDSDNDPVQSLSITFNPTGVFSQLPDLVIGDTINIYVGVDEPEDNNKFVRAEILSYDINTGSATLKILSGTKNINSISGEWYVELEQAEPLFQFKFPRFGIRYKYEDGEYSSFSPFSQVAFLPQEFDYLPKEGYNLGMVNNLRFLAIKDFVHGQYIPDDVISVDILYKESNSPNIYTVKTIKRLENDWVPGLEPWSSNISSLDDVVANYSEWNAIGPRDTVGAANGLVPGQLTRGWTRITSEMIHAILPSNQLLRPYDNVPRVALAQEVVGNRLVYGNYLQNYNMFNRFAVHTKALEYFNEFNYGELDPQSQINVDIKASVTSKIPGNAGQLLPEQSDPFYSYLNLYLPAKSIKTLRTYQLGVAYIDEYGRETPVFSNSTIDKASLYVEKIVADKKNRLQAQLFNTHPEWAKSFKFFVKETSNEYYNLAMDRWYNAEDGNIWISFPSSERNKIDEETFLILKKEHDNNNFVSSPARYKVIAIENEAPIFVKTSTLQQPTFLDTKSVAPFDIGGAGGNFPEVGGDSFLLDNAALTSSGWETSLNLSTPPNPNESVVIRDYDIRITGTAGGADFSSNWYRLKGIAASGTDHLFTIFKKFEADVNVLSPTGTASGYTGGGRIELRKRVIDNKPEFDGRFFVKIKRDADLEQTIIKPVSSSINWQINNSMRVQYINPDSDFSKSADANWFGVWDQTATPEQAISLADTVGSGNGCGTDVEFQRDQRGKGQDYWEMASHNTDSSVADSSGWFIDKIEGFRRFKTTTHYFGQNNTDPWLTKHQASAMRNAGGGVGDFYYYWQTSGYNWNGSPGGSNGNAKNRFDMPVVMGTATHSSSDTGSYLNLSHADGGFGGSRPDDANVNGPSYIGTSGATSFPGTDWLDPSFSNNFHVLDDDNNPIPGKAFNEQAIINNIDGFADHINQSVLRTGLNGYLQHVGQSFADLGTIGSLTGNGGGILPSLGIDGHPLAGSAGGANPDHTGLLKGVNSYQGTNIITISHAGVGGDDEQVEDPEGRDAPTQGTNVSDLVLALEFGANQTGYTVKHVNDIAFANALRTPGTAWRWAEDPGQIIYKTIDPNTVDLSGWGITSAEININFTGNDPLDGEPGIGLYNYCSLGDWADEFLMWGETNSSRNKDYRRATVVSQGAGSMSAPAPSDYVYVATGGYSTIGQPHWKYSDAYTNPGANWKDEYVEVATSNTCGGWQVRSYNTAAHGMWPMYVKDWWKAKNRRRRFMIVAESYDGGLGLGETGPHHYLPTNDPTLTPHFDTNEEVKTGASIPDTPAPGIRSDGVYSSYSIGGDVVPSGPTKDGTAGNLKYPGSVTWQILSPYVDTDSEKYSSTNPAIFETEPKENVDLNIYYEVGQIYPIELNEKTGEQFVGPIHPSIPLASLNSKVNCYDPNPVTNPAGNFRNIQTGGAVLGLGAAADIRVESLQDNVLTLCNVDGGKLNTNINPTATLPEPGDRLIFSRADGGKTETTVLNVNPNTGEFTLDRALHNYKVTLPWHNCYSFGNGVESDRIRDDFNQVTIDNGPKASATLEEPYEEERRGSGLIYSGIYNSMSGVNNLNQFIQAEKITKDLNPSYGTIQKLYARNTNLVTLCEDKVFKILANKDALFNADGNSNVTATDRVLGQTIPYAGDFGISKNPESFVNESYRAYFTDKVRGQVLRLSQDGITPISDAGMSDWFSDNLKLANRLIGSYDEKKDEYNLTLDHNEYPIAQPVQVIDNFMIQIEVPELNRPSLARTTSSGPQFNILAPITVGITAGMVINGSGLAPNTVVTAVTPNFNYLILRVNPEPDFTELVSLFGPNPNAWQIHVALGTQPDPVSTYTNTSGNYDLTVSFSERSKGWTSFKSWAQESGVSLNNTYYTFKDGHLHEHHVESQPRNNFYGDQYDSSIEVLFNEAPDAVKSFNSLNYEGSQSRVTPDTENSGEYWDNYLHTGWYVSNMLTNLQEGSMQEFREKEGKWFSQIKGVTTEWLDDGKAGNIDTREFSYQGIDEADDVTIISGGYTSYNCVQRTGPQARLANNYFCEEIQGQDGEYATLAACEAVCGINVETYECINGQCIDPGDGSGSYSTYCECVNDSLCCEEGLAYAYTCQNIAEPTPVIPGCMDDGITTDPYTTRFRPSDWSANTDYGGPFLGAASNYYPAANTPDCSCQYNIPPIPETIDCSGPNGATVTFPDGSTQTFGPYHCYDPGDGTGQYNQASAIASGFANPLAQCNSSCQPQPCVPTNYYTVDTINTINTTTNDGCVTGQAGIVLSNMVSDVIVELQDLSGTVIASQTLTAPVASYTFINLADGDYNINIYDVVDSCGDVYPVTITCDQSPGSCDVENWAVSHVILNNFNATSCLDNTTITQHGVVPLTVSANGFGQSSGTYTITKVEARYANMPAPDDVTSTVSANGMQINSAGYINSGGHNIGSSVVLDFSTWSVNQQNNVVANQNAYGFEVTLFDGNCYFTHLVLISCSQPVPEDPWQSCTMLTNTDGSLAFDSITPTGNQLWATSANYQGQLAQTPQGTIVTHSTTLEGNGSIYIPVVTKNTVPHPGGSYSALDYTEFKVEVFVRIPEQGNKQRWTRIEGPWSQYPGTNAQIVKYEFGVHAVSIPNLPGHAGNDGIISSQNVSNPSTVDKSLHRPSGGYWNNGGASHYKVVITSVSSGLQSGISGAHDCKTVLFFEVGYIAPDGSNNLSYDVPPGSSLVQDANGNNFIMDQNAIIAHYVRRTNIYQTQGPDVTVHNLVNSFNANADYLSGNFSSQAFETAAWIGTTELGPSDPEYNNIGPNGLECHNDLNCWNNSTSGQVPVGHHFTTYTTVTNYTYPWGSTFSGAVFSSWIPLSGAVTGTPSPYVEP